MGTVFHFMNFLVSTVILGLEQQCDTVIRVEIKNMYMLNLFKEKLYHLPQVDLGLSDPYII